MLKTTVLPKVTVSSDEVTRQRTEITLMSYDKNVHQIKIPTDLTEGEINRVIVIFTFPFDKSVIQLNGAWVDGHIQFTLPEILRTQRGDFYIEVNIDLTDSQITFARYRAKVVKSDIDANVSQVQTVYFELFEDFVTEVADNAQQAKGVIDAQTTGVESHADTSKQTMDSDVNSVHDYGVGAKTTIDAKVDSVEQAKTDALTAIDSDVASVDTYAIDAKSNVDGLVSDATTAIDAKVANVELTKNQALSDIADKQQDVTDTTSQFKSDLSDTQTSIDNQVILANNALNQLDTSLTGLNNKMDLADTTATNVIADATTKGQQVTTKYNEFDANVAQANQTITNILALQDNADVKIKNHVLNGLDFAQNWTGKQATTSVLDGVLTKTPTAIGSYVNSVTPLNYTDKFYMTSLVKTTDDKLRHMTSYPNASNYHSGSGQFERLSSILNVEDTTGDVGGRNLLLNSNFLNGHNDWYNTGEAKVVDVDNKKAMLLTGQEKGFYHIPKNNGYLSGLYTFYFIAKADGSTSQVKIGFLNQKDGRSKILNITSEWGVYTYTTSTALEVGGQLIHIYATPNTGDGLYITDIMLVKGTKPPESYTPAPEDGIELQWAKSSNETLLPAEIKQPIVINLTQIFGAGNEPTKTEMDELIKVIGGWFDGEITLTQKQQLTWLLNLIRKNAMAVTALGGTIL